jgi:hypothetical protein
MSDIEALNHQNESRNSQEEKLDVEKGSEKGELAPSELTWDSEDDPDNPRNWPFGKRVFHTAVPALFGFVM